MRVNAISFYQYPLEQAISLIKSAGYDSVEVFPGHLSRQSSVYARKSFKNYVEEMGMNLYGVAFDGEAFKPFGSKEDRNDAVQHLCHYIDMAFDLDAKAVIAWEGIRPMGGGNASILSMAVEIFSQAVKYAEDKQIRIFVEPHPFTFGMDVDLLCEFIDRVNSPLLGVLYDNCHFGVGRPYDYSAVIRRLSHRIHHIHFSDCDGVTPELHLPPGEGVLDLEKIVRELIHIKYNGTMTLDLYLHSQPIDGAIKSREYMNQLQDRLALSNS